jgi:hypothetical protein
MTTDMKIVFIWKTSYGYFNSEEGCKRRREYDHYLGRNVPETPVQILAILTSEGKYYPVTELKGSVDVK